MSPRITEAELLEWSGNVGPETLRAFQDHIRMNAACGYSFCVGVRNLGIQYGEEAVESACALLHRCGGMATLRMVRKYVTAESLLPDIFEGYAKDVHATPGITRGSEYFENRNSERSTT